VGYSPRGCSSCQELASSTGSRLPSGHTHLLQHGVLHRLQEVLHRGPPWAAWVQPASLWSSPAAAGESLLRHLEHLLALLLLTWVSAVLFLSHILTLFQLLLCSIFLFILKCYHIQALAPLLMGSVLSSGRSVLELAGTSFVPHRGSFLHLLTEGTPAFLHYQNLAM